MNNSILINNKFLPNEQAHELNSETRETIFNSVIDIVKVYLSHNACSADQLPRLLSQLHQTALQLVQDDRTALSGSYHQNIDSQEAAKERVPAVPVEQSVTDDFLICLEDGKTCKLLARYVFKRFGLSEEQYRQRWNLPADYPMVAPALSRKRALCAQQIRPHLAKRNVENGAGKKNGALSLSA